MRLLLVSRWVGGELRLQNVLAGCSRLSCPQEHFQVETLCVSNHTPVVSRKHRGFSARFWPGGTVLPPRVLPFSMTKRSGVRLGTGPADAAHCSMAPEGHLSWSVFVCGAFVPLKTVEAESTLGRMEKRLPAACTDGGAGVTETAAVRAPGKRGIGCHLSGGYAGKSWRSSSWMSCSSAGMASPCGHCLAHWPQPMQEGKAMPFARACPYWILAQCVSLNSL